MVIKRNGLAMAALLLLTVLCLSRPVWLVAAPMDDLEPGTAVVFVAGSGSGSAIMMVDPADGRPVLLADMPGALDVQPTVGPGGRLAWIRRVGPEWQLIEDAEIVSRGRDMHLSPAFMPNGVLTAAVSGPDSTSIYSFQDQSKRLFMQGEGGLAVSPAFSPDGKLLAFVSNSSGLGQIHLAEVGQKTSRQLTTSTVRNTDPAWSPDGRWIVFVTAETDICLISAEGGELKQLTENQGFNGHPFFSPDGRHIVFYSDRNGQTQLFTMRRDGTGQYPLLPDFSAAQSSPVWTAEPPPNRPILSTNVK